MRRVLVVCGLRREAALVAGPRVLAVTGGGDQASLARRLDQLDPASIAATVSFGFAGSLATNIPVGSVVVADRVLGGAEEFEASPTLRDGWLGLLRSTGLEARRVTLAGVDAPVLTAAGKAGLASRTGAAVVDMESHLAARFAARHGLPFGVLRSISDGADAALPALAGAAMRPDGSVDVIGVMKGLARDPAQLPALLATARDAGRAFRALRRVRGLLGPDLGLHL